jgi:hypothetical protein
MLTILVFEIKEGKKHKKFKKKLTIIYYYLLEGDVLWGAYSCRNFFKFEARK